MLKAVLSYPMHPEYGVVYDNGMKLETLYDGRHFPPYLYKSPVMALETVSGSGAEVDFCLPMPDRQIRRMIERVNCSLALQGKPRNLPNPPFYRKNFFL